MYLFNSLDNYIEQVVIVDQRKKKGMDLWRFLSYISLICEYWYMSLIQIGKWMNRRNLLLYSMKHVSVTDKWVINNCLLGHSSLWVKETWCSNLNVAKYSVQVIFGKGHHKPSFYRHWLKLLVEEGKLESEYKSLNLRKWVDRCRRYHFKKGGGKRGN